jgi:hypothetical protein
MKPFEPVLFMIVMRLYENLSVTSLMAKQMSDGTSELSSFARKNHAKLLESWENSFHELELTASVATVRRMRDLVSKETCDAHGLASLGEELKGRISDEMMEKLYLSLSMAEIEHYTNWKKGWETVIDRFPQTIGDIEESRKCFALSRYAASVFHSLQIVEAALIELGTFIHVTDPRSGWTAVTGKLKKIVATKHDDLSDFEKKHFEFLEQIHGTAEALKNAWRNKISHTQGRLVLLGTDFSPEIAEEILFASRSFVRRLAEGLPTAKH